MIMRRRRENFALLDSENSDFYSKINRKPCSKPQNFRLRRHHRIQSPRGAKQGGNFCEDMLWYLKLRVFSSVAQKSPYMSNVWIFSAAFGDFEKVVPLHFSTIWNLHVCQSLVDISWFQNLHICQTPYMSVATVPVPVRYQSCGHSYGSLEDLQKGGYLYPGICSDKIKKRNPWQKIYNAFSAHNICSHRKIY